MKKFVIALLIALLIVVSYSIKKMHPNHREKNYEVEDTVVFYVNGKPLNQKEYPVRLIKAMYGYSQNWEVGVFRIHYYYNHPHPGCRHWVDRDTASIPIEDIFSF